MSVDVLIQTYNEELNLPHTLQSVTQWAGRVFVVDSGSTDRTRELAEEAGATVVHHDWEGYARQKNWALDNLPFEADWILILDADEAVSDELREEVLAVTSQPVDDVGYAGFLINRLFIFLDRPIRHCGYFPSWNLRLFKRGKARYEDRTVHEHMLCDGEVGRLKHLLIHEDRRGLEHFFAKHNRYSTLEAAEIVDRPEPWPGWSNLARHRLSRLRFIKSRVMPVVPLAWMCRFIYMYVFRLGLLDGRAGWWLSLFISHYEFQVQLKIRALGMDRGRRHTGVALAEPEGSIDSTQAVQVSTYGPATRLHAADPDTKSVAHAGVASAGVKASTGPRWAAPTLVTRSGRASRYKGVNGSSDSSSEGEPDLQYVSPWSTRQNVARALWIVASAMLFQTSFHNWYGWRRLLLRLFGAKLGKDVRVRPSAHIEIPWNLEIDDGAVVGDEAILYSLGKVKIGKRTVISQYAHLCAGTHDHRYRDFPLLRPPVTVGADCWIAADAFVGPGVTVGDRTVVGARSSVFADLPAGVVAVGNPARPVKERVLSNPGLPEATAPVPETVQPQG